MLGERRAVSGDVLRGVVDGELVAVSTPASKLAGDPGLPPGERGVRLHGVVVLERRDVGVVDGDRAAAECGVEIATDLLCAAAGIFWRARMLEAAHEVEQCGIFAVGDVEQARRLHGLRQTARDDDGDGLAVVVDVCVLQDADVAASGPGWVDGKFGRVEGRENGDDAGGAFGRLSVDGLDGTSGNGGLHHVRVDEVLAREGLAELGGVLGGAGDLGNAVVAVRWLREGVRLFILLHHAWTPCTACVRARTMHCLASSILKALFL